MNNLELVKQSIITSFVGLVFGLGLLVVLACVWVVVELKTGAEIHTITAVNGMPTLYYSIETDNTLLIELIK